MEKGSIYIVVHFPKYFPDGINTKTEIFSSLVENSTFKIYGYPDGHLLLIVESQDFIYSKFESQKIRFQSDRDIIITYIWSDSQKTFEVNNKKVDSNLSKEILVISNDSPPQKEELKNINLNQNSNIEKWIEWRKMRFLNNVNSTKMGRRKKSEDEQIKELSDVINNLEDTYREWLTGKDYLTMSLLALLRSLLCHKIIEKNPKYITYNPLLFRIASIKHLSLPIYARQVKKEIPNNALNILSDNKTLYHITVNEATITKTSNSQILMDFQEWINGEVIISFENKNPNYYTINDMMLESSNTIGASHFDPDIPIKIDFLKNTTSSEIDLIKRIVSNTVQISIHHSKYVLSHFKIE